MTDTAVVAYIPVLHEGYRRFLQRHARDKALYLIGPQLYEDYRPLAKDIRALDADLVRAAVAGWDLCASVAVLDVQGAERLAATGPALVLPAEDVSYQVVERHFPRCSVHYDTTFLRWDKSRSVQLLDPGAARTVTTPAAIAELAGAAEQEAARSVDWWRRVGAAIRFADGSIASTHNEANPHPLSPYVVGDPRANFFRGVNLEVSTATHAEARLIAGAARAGRATDGATMYVTDFPCPPCAKLIAGAGITRLYYRDGYAVLDGRDVLEAAAVEIVQITD